MIHEKKTGPAVWLSAGEQRFLGGVRDSRPDLVEPWLSNLPRARRAATHRLLQSFLMESIGWLAGRVSWEDGELSVPLPGGRTLRCLCSRRYLSGRFDPAGERLLLVGDGGAESIESPSRLLEVFGGAGLLPEGADPARFRSEVENGVANHALSLAGAERRRRGLAVTARNLGAGSSLALARRLAGQGGEFSPLAFFEQLVYEGHPLHPAAKLKEGLSAAEAVRYSPEWGAVLDLALVAVRGDVCREVSCGEGFRKILMGEHPETGRAFEKGLRARGRDPARYTPIPVHPWQLVNTLPRFHAGALARGEAVPIPEARIPARPLMSFRSLAPVGGGHHVKTAVNVRLTNAVRTVSRNSVENAAELTRVLRKVRLREGFGERFAVLEERAGAYYDPPEGEAGEDERPVLSKNLAAILREAPEPRLRRGELALPAAALLAESPAGGPVLAELVEEFARAGGVRCLEKASGLFFRRYCEVSVPGFLIFMSRYGIGLEGHLQNCLPVFRAGVPVRMLVRDFGGVRVLRSRLRARGLDVSLYPGSDVAARDQDDLRAKVFYPLVLNHLGELAVGFSRAFDVGEARYWSAAAAVSRAVYTGLRRDPAAREDERALFAANLPFKALATMRLLGKVTDYAYAEVPNPLAAAGGRR